MNTIDIIDITQNEISDLVLTDDYRFKGYTKNFNSHLDALIDTSISITGEDNSVFKSNTIGITNSLYWQTESHILENLDDVTDNQILDKLDNLEDLLYSKIITKLGVNYNRTYIENKMIDISVHNVLMSVKFNYFSSANEFNNPWIPAKNILFDNFVLHTFSNNVDDFSEYGLKLNEKESEITRYNHIGILGKGNRRDFTTGFIRDLVGLRNNLLKILEDDGHTSSKPIKTNDIISKLRLLGALDNNFTNSNVIRWLIAPLKDNNKLGSTKEGFFVIKNCDDLEVSYSSHLENLKGYYKTLEKHRLLADKFPCTNVSFEQHKEFFKNNI